MKRSLIPICRNQWIKLITEYNLDMSSQNDSNEHVQLKVES